MKGSFGYIPDRKATDKFVASLKYPTWQDAAPTIQLDDSAGPTLLYQPLLELAPWWTRGSQKNVGSCVGWGASYAVDCTAATEICLHGEPESWGGRVLEASVYAFSRCEARGVTNAGYSDGSYGAAAAEALQNWGVLCYGVKYGERVFTEHSSELEKSWGATGVPPALEPFAHEHRATTTLVTDFHSAAIALQNGYGIFVCSNQGFATTRSKTSLGFCKPSGVWNHCMALAGVRFDQPGLLCVNSWGDYLSNTGPNWPDNMPPAMTGCSFWVDEKTCNKMLSQNDSFAVSNYAGFPARKLKGFGFNDF